VTPGYLEHARQVADAVLYEGYLLYPYHQAAQKNQVRFQFGVLMPPGWAAVDPTEASRSQTECLLDCADDAQVDVRIRFLQVQRRLVQAQSRGEWRDVHALTVAGTEHTAFDEAVEHEEQVTAVVAALLKGDSDVELAIDGGVTVTELPGGAGRLVRQREPLTARVRLHAERVAGPYQALRLRVELENITAPAATIRTRQDGLRHALVAAHNLIGVPGGRFLSLTDPPEWAAADAAACENVGTWPVLAGPAQCTELVLSSPLILYDHPQIAAESAGNLFDATEIDEILTLRTMVLTDEEKQRARTTDPRAAELIDRLDHLPPEMLERMHGAIRYLNAVPSLPTAGSVPWWDPGSDASVSPETDHVVIDGIQVRKDSRVIMRPGNRRADAQDLFLAGREAVVEAVLFDVDGQVHLAVTPADDPAADLQRSHGRFLYFTPEEVAPIGRDTATETAEGGTL
jgi:hypothetical protein